MKTTHTAVLFVLSLCLSAFSMAGERYSIAYSKADFRTTESVEQLHKKIVRTARAHCPDYSRTRSLSNTYDCIDAVVADITASIDQPALTALVHGKADARLAGKSQPANEQG